jgi:lipoate-protein ligase A
VVELRIIVDAPAPGPLNMAVDELLLMEAVESGIATLRFYAWCEPTLSLGYFQRYDDRYSHAASSTCPLVRRQTGGGAILHDRELTYSVCLPATHALARQSEDLYTAVHEAFIAELTPELAAARSGWRLLRHAGPSNVAANEEPFLCFQRRARGDVLLVHQASDDVQPRMAMDLSPPVKILGSAQRRHRGAILQHGSLLLDKSAKAPELAGLQVVTGTDISVAQLIDKLTVRLTREIGGPQSPARITSANLQSKAEQLANIKYGSLAWTKRR